jgi:hypothetical protein
LDVRGEIEAPGCFTYEETPSDITRFEVFMAVTVRNAVFWDIKTKFIPHKRHITSPLQSPAG